MNKVQRSCTGTKLAIPDGITPIRGVRVFGLDNRGRLSAAKFRHYYNPNENIASCQRNRSPVEGSVDPRDIHPIDDQAPSPLCTCGFYGFWDYEAYLEENWNRGVRWDEMHHVVGVIEAYGRVLLGTKGFRAQKARVVAVNVKDIRGYGAVRRMERLYPNIKIFENEVKTERKGKNPKFVVGSGTELMVAEFPLYEPGDEEEIWEWDRG